MMPHRNFGISFRLRVALAIALAIGLSGWTQASASTMVYQDYVVRYDRGWDILCEPYVVQPDDWVLKIFRQKGEIAHQDFREFLGIFQRLNPHIPNVDMVRPGQTIDIPLRKLEHGDLPGQASGVVTIPFVSLTRKAEAVKAVDKNLEAYMIRPGDTVSKLIARRFGAFGSKGYEEGLRLFQEANPQVSDLNVIYAGRRVYLPDPSLREPAVAGTTDNNKGGVSGTAEAPQASGDNTATAESAGAATRPRQPAADKTPAAAGVLDQAAAILGGSLKDKGTFYLPRQGSKDFEVDLSRYPMLDFPDGRQVLFARQDRVMGLPAGEIGRSQPKIKIVSYDSDASTSEMVGRIFDALEKQPEGQGGSEVVFADIGVRVAVRSKWVEPQSDYRHLCITPIDSTDQQTPEYMRRYLEQNGVVLKEILPGGQASPAADNAGNRHAVKNVLVLAPGNGPKDFVRNLAHALHFTFTPGAPVSFPYAGMQVTAYADLLSTGNGHEVLVDFGELYGETADAIRRSGPALVQIDPREQAARIVSKLFSALGLEFSENPTFMAARRPPQFNTTIAVDGILYIQSPGKRILLASADLNPAVTDLVSAQGIDAILWQ